MNFKETIEKIRLYFEEEKAPVVPTAPVIPTAAVVEVKQSIDYETTEGTTVSIDILEVGGIVTKENAPVEDGNYTLKDGTTFKTTNGVIENITLPVAPTAPVVDEELKKEMEVTKEQFAKIKTLESKLENQNNTLKLLFSLVEEMGNNSSIQTVEPTENYLTENYKKVLQNRGKL